MHGEHFGRTFESTTSDDLQTLRMQMPKYFFSLGAIFYYLYKEQESI